MNLIFSIVLLFVFGCQGMPSKKPPIHLNPNMDDQERFDPQESNPFFENNMSMRVPPEAVSYTHLTLPTICSV